MLVKVVVTQDTIDNILNTTSSSTSTPETNKDLHQDLRARNAGKQKRISVQDFGEGIAPDEQDKIFNRFYRVDKARSTSTPETNKDLHQDLRARNAGKQKRPNDSDKN